MEGFQATPDDGGIAKRLWVKFKNESLCALYTPFIVCLASGTLDSKSFLHCISQDVYFLQAFAQAYELAEDFADDDEDKEAIRDLRKRVLRKLKDQDDLVREWGFELPNNSTCDSATVRYTDFLLATAAGKVEGEKFTGKIVTPFEKTRLAAYALSVIAPCMRLYSFLSKEIKSVLVPEENNNIYERWIDCLCSESFEAYASRIEDLLDKLSVCLTGEELDVVERLYHQAMKLELEFISAQPITQSTVTPISQVQEPAGCNLTMFCDFDMTCSAVDSSALLADVAIIAAAKSDLDDCETLYPRVSAADLRATWSNLSSKYIEEYEQCIESIIPSETVGRFDYEGLCKALEQLSDFERRANDMVVRSGVLRGLSQEDIKRAGERLIFQNGCKNIFQEILGTENLHADVHVLSYCWSGDLIRSAFSSAGVLPVLNVHSNELPYEGSVTTGDMIKKMESPMDKLQAFNDILKSRESNSKHTTVYVGGSVGDLLCLLNADVGIVIGLSAGLRRLGEQFGISFVPLFSGLVTKQRKLAEGSLKGMSGILYTVSSWSEIHAFILGL
ncbi:bifunctional TH2 protein, mitochondrial-like isoform X1 [Nicotiana tomentosiformis]|uniref:bifunctional TH2 protein, mitochondrial-like isoform X1 n=1 Tax=Nicotiana tomentosiformis TaxID=4098 RepID=UPI00051C20A0|nr:bifunctional TH2 protein, mitochondrial-like isoform X1 [Nicotiana tomentosiformis]